MPRPRTGETPIRRVRIDDKTWDRVERAAEEDGKTASGVVREAVTEHLDRRDRG
jgi:predicted DNA-binding protein